jgi:phospholipase/carboxylesterase
MDELLPAELDAVLGPLLETLEALGFIARFLEPTELAALIGAVGAPDGELRAVMPRMRGWPEDLAGSRAALEPASEAALGAFEGLRAAAQGHDLRGVMRALRGSAEAQEALYPLAARMSPVGRFFLPPRLREDTGLLARLAAAPADGRETGVHHVDNEPGSRGGFSLYVPEHYTPDRAWPLAMALHGGSGNGRAFLWSWLRDARGHGAILVAPTAVGPTWALMGEDADTPNLARILEHVRGRWRIDPARLLLTGMSDGGTFCYVSGLEPASPFTHLAPVAAAFHPLLAQAADADRLLGLPIHLVHGARDWMFPVEMARGAARALSAAGARVTYREIADLPHCYPREINGDLLAWLEATPARRAAG